MPRLVCPVCRGPRLRVPEPVCGDCERWLPEPMYDLLRRRWQQRSRAHRDWQEQLADALSWARANRP